MLKNLKNPALAGFFTFTRNLLIYFASRNKRLNKPKFNCL
ncbi:hypothetical protein JCM19538_1935 [Jejuia pallidilutea]|uniref:Uncharacterized protein n=1 Tax=Jejuia pallidilutea TaxID=504487 RepID=A0A098LPU8_9FLAO|nr:hypothetical protein JCM19538_1935 [Jejuia pallidilutea]